MNTIRLNITGPRVVDLVQTVQGYVGKHYVFVHDPIVVIIAETYYFRIDGTLQSTLVFEFQDETTCQLDLVSGGGGAGLIFIDRSSELSSNFELLRAIRQMCDAHGWKVTEQPSPS